MELSKSKNNETTGSVTLVGFGPGNPDLLTIAGEKAIAEADIIFHDDLIDQEFLNKYQAEKVYVGKRRHKHSANQDDINQLLLDAALSGKKVVRVKGGDPMVFAHGGEEIQLLEKYNVPVTVIPGISTGLAVASLTKVPLTHRNISSSVSFISGHAAEIGLPNTDTLVCYMAGFNIHRIAAKAIAEGRDPQTAVMLVSKVSTPEQQEFSRSAPGTEAFKQDRSEWDSLRKNVDQALEKYEASVSSRLSRARTDDRFSSGGSDRVPEAYRQIIARYYESLAKKKP